MPNTVIRPAAASDAPAIGQLVTQLGYPTSAEAMRIRLGNLLARPDYVTLVAESSGRIVGVAAAYLSSALEFDGSAGRLSGLVVDPSCRGRGVGRSLVERIEAWARERGARKITLTSKHRRIEAHAFYRRLGYTETGLRFAKEL